MASDAPRHVWPTQKQLEGINGREWVGDYRYTRTDGPEWDALMERAKEAKMRFVPSATFSPT